MADHAINQPAQNPFDGDESKYTADPYSTYPAGTYAMEVSPLEAAQLSQYDDIVEPTDGEPPMAPMSAVAMNPVPNTLHGFAPDDDPSHLESFLEAKGSGGVNLTNWSSVATHVQTGAVIVAIILMSISLNLLDWKRGASLEGDCGSKDGCPARVGLYYLEVNDQTLSLDSLCNAGQPESTACSLASAGSATAGLLWTAMSMAILELLYFILAILHQMGKLEPVMQKVPHDKIPGTALKLIPTACWALLWLFNFLSLLVYPASSPPSLGEGLAVLDTGFGLIRLTLIVVTVGVAIHLIMLARNPPIPALAMPLWEEHLLQLLDSMHSHWKQMEPNQKALQGILAGAMVCYFFIWMEREDWSVLLLPFGMQAAAVHNSLQLYTFMGLTAFSTVFDAITLAAFDPWATLSGGNKFVLMLSWIVFMIKAGTVGMLTFFKPMFFTPS